MMCNTLTNGSQHSLYSLSNVKKDMKPHLKTLVYAVGVTLVVILFLSKSGAQTNTPTPSPPNSEESSVREERQKVEQLTSTVQDLKTQNAVLARELDRLTTTFYFVAGLV